MTSDLLTVEEVAEALMVRPTSILEYRSGDRAMPLEVQALLVALTIERVPAHERMARGLRAQIQAAMTYASGETVAHFEPPPMQRK